MSLSLLSPDFTHGDYHYKKATTTDLPLIRRWLGAHHLSAWWTPNEDELAAIMADEAGQAAYIVDHGGLPFAFIYLCDPAHDPDLSEQIDFPKGTIRFDQFIGDEHMIGVGHGVKFIKAFIAGMKITPGITRLMALPATGNMFAMRSYSQSGLRAERTFQYRGISVTLMGLSIA